MNIDSFLEEDKRDSEPLVISKIIASHKADEPINNSRINAEKIEGYIYVKELKPLRKYLIDFEVTCFIADYSKNSNMVPIFTLKTITKTPETLSISLSHKSLRIPFCLYLGKNKAGRLPPSFKVDKYETYYELKVLIKDVDDESNKSERKEKININKAIEKIPPDSPIFKYKGDKIDCFEKWVYGESINFRHEFGGSSKIKRVRINIYAELFRKKANGVRESLLKFPFLRDFRIENNDGQLIETKEISLEIKKSNQTGDVNDINLPSFNEDYFECKYIISFQIVQKKKRFPCCCFPLSGPPELRKEIENVLSKKEKKENSFTEDVEDSCEYHTFHLE